MAKVRATFSLGKLSRKLEKTIATGLNTMMNHLNKEIQENLEKQKDINGHPYEDLSESTGTQRINKEGYYKQAGGGGILNYTGRMRKTKKTPAKPGPAPVATLEMVGKRKGVHYGAFHNEGASSRSRGGNLPQRKWFGLTKSMEPDGKARKTAMGIISLGIIQGWKK